MSLPEPLRSFWRAYESLGSRIHTTPWGVVATDARYPRIYDANHAGILDPSPNLTLATIRAELIPALRRVGCPYEHIEFMDTVEDCPAYRELRDALPDATPDALMVFESKTAPEPDVEARIAEVIAPDEAFWHLYRDSRMEFGEEMDAGILDELVRRDQEVFVPAGLRIFAGTVGDEAAGFASIISLAGVGYVDNVVTFPAFRRRGVGSATVAAVVQASLEAGDEMTFLFAVDGGAPQGLYERLGFRTLQKAIGFTRPLSA